MSGPVSGSFKQAHQAPLNLLTVPKPTILLVHGGWTGPETFSKIIVLLESKGYSTYAPTLPSAGTIPALPNFNEDVDTIRNIVRCLIDSGKEVVIVMHSYGAIPGCEAMRDLKTKKMHSGELGGGVIKLVFLAGLVVPVGGSTWKSEKGEVPIPGFVYQNGLITITDGQTRFFNDLSPAEAELWNEKLKPHSRGAYASKLTYPAYRFIPSSYLLCTNDAAHPLKLQERMVAHAGIRETTRVHTGHCAHLSQPTVVERFIRKSVGEFREFREFHAKL